MKIHFTTRGKYGRVEVILQLVKGLVKARINFLGPKERKGKVPSLTNTSLAILFIGGGAPGLQSLHTRPES